MIERRVSLFRRPSRFVVEDVAVASCQDRFE